MLQILAAERPLTKIWDSTSNNELNEITFFIVFVFITVATFKLILLSVWCSSPLNFLIHLDLDDNCQTSGGYCGKICMPTGSGTIYQYQTAGFGRMVPKRIKVKESGNEFHSVTVLAAKDCWYWVEAQRGILNLCLVGGPLTGLGHRTKSRWLIGTATCSILCRKTGSPPLDSPLHHCLWCNVW